MRYVLVLAALSLTGCTSDTLNLAPDTSERPWLIPATSLPTNCNDRNQSGSPSPPAGEGRGEGCRPISGDTTPASATSEPAAAPSNLASTASQSATPVDRNRRYDLPALIDLAQRNNPQTREAWERARQAALAVGLVESAYVPQLSAEALAGYQRTPLPIPKSLIPQGYFTTDTYELIPSLAVKWLLFDFGRRAAAEQNARENSFVANVAFTGVHQKLIFAVSRSYFELGAARGKLRAAEHALKTTELDRDAVLARRANGLATTVDVAKVQRQTAQSRFNLARATGAERTAYADLIASVGLDPTTEILVADDSEQPLPATPSEGVGHYVTQALSNRPDVIAGLGKVRAAQATLEKERAEHKPSIALVGRLYQNFGGLSTEGSPYYNVNKPGGALFVQLSWPILDGGRRDRQVMIAQSEVNAAGDALEQIRNTAAKQVADAYHALTTALAEHDAALTLTEAAQTAHSAALSAYRHGVGTYTSLSDEQNALIQAETSLEDARATVFTAASALAFATSSLSTALDSR